MRELMLDARLFFGDCLEVMAELPDGSIDMVCTDPPYGTTACAWDAIIPLEPMWSQLKRLIKPNGAIVLMASQPFTTSLIASNMKMFKYCLVWQKVFVSGFLNAKKQPLRKHEDIIVFYQQQPSYNPQCTTGLRYSVFRKHSTECYGSQRDNSTRSDGTRYPVSVVGVPYKREGLHPTQKPVALMEYLIKTYSNEGETVLDFTMGSGTTGVAAINTSRRFVGIENNRKYFDVAIDRCRKEAIKALRLRGKRFSISARPKSHCDGPVHAMVIDGQSGGSNG
jgi:DNA modification methylase